MDLLLAAGLLLAGALCGSALVLTMSRARSASAFDAALARAEAPQRVEIARLTERASRIGALELQLERHLQVLDERGVELANLRETAGRLNAQLQAELDGERQSCARMQADLARERAAHQLAATESAALRAENAALVARLRSEQQQGSEKLAMLLEAKEELADRFKALANDILEEKSRRFAEQNQLNLGQLLDPLKSKIAEFQTKVEDVYVKEGHARTALSEQVRQLVELNQSIGQDARNLTSALKGSAKTQGNWGELILERVLEASGLSKGQFYQVQDSRLRDDGSRAQPDVVISLPGERRLVVDAKASLVAYERYVAAGDDASRALAARMHLDSVRSHIRGLSDKNYHELYGIRSLDFVVMFMPIESAFMLAVTNDDCLFMDAWRRNVLLVSPSTLLFVVRTVAYLWTQDAQGRNAQEIARRGAELYDKLVGFVADLQAVGSRLRQANDSYDEAFRKFTTGRGNLIWQAESLRKLGVKPNKSLPEALRDDTSQAGDEVQTEPDAGAAAQSWPDGADDGFELQPKQVRPPLAMTPDEPES